MIDQLKPLIGKLALFSQKRFGFKNPPRLFFRNDSYNSQKVLGKTAFYNPSEQSITLFTHKRHPKDILRSFAHELVHHTQNERGDLTPDNLANMGKNYAQDDEHMRNMEKEAYLQGNMCFRDWEDTIKDKDKFLIKLAESKFLKENKTMTTKITKEFLREMIEEKIKQRFHESTLSEDKRAVILTKAQKDRVKEKGRKHGLKSAKVELRKIIKKIMKDRGIPVSGSNLPQVVNDYFDSSNAAKNISTAGFKQAGDRKSQVAPTGKDPEIKENLEELEIVGGMPQGPDSGTSIKDLPKAKPDLIIKQTLKDAVKKLQEEQMLELQEAIAILKEELDSMLTSGADQPELEEGGCGPAKVDDDDDMKEGKGSCVHCEGKGCPKCPTNEEIEESSDKDGDGHVVPDWADQDDNDPKVGPKKTKSESKIQTPEQENNLYEQRFTPRNTRLYEKLLKEWTK